MKNAIIKEKRFDSIKSFEQIMGEIVSMSDSDENRQTKQQQCWKKLEYPVNNWSKNTWWHVKLFDVLNRGY